MSRTRPIPAVRALLLVAAVAFALSGCTAAPAPTPDPTRRSASPRPEPTPTATDAGPRVEIDGRGVTVVDDSGTTTLRLAYTADPGNAVARLDSVLGERSQTASVTDDRCYPQLDESSWGGLHVWSSADGLSRPDGARFYVTADAPTTGGGIPIRMPSGQSVGDPKTEVLAANPSAPSFPDGNAVDLHYDIVAGTAAGDPNAYYGALAKIVGARLASLDAPVYFSRPC